MTDDRLVSNLHGFVLLYLSIAHGVRVTEPDAPKAGLADPIEMRSNSHEPTVSIQLGRCWQDPCSAQSTHREHWRNSKAAIVVWNVAVLPMMLAYPNTLGKLLLVTYEAFPLRLTLLEDVIRGYRQNRQLVEPLPLLPARCRNYEHRLSISTPDVEKDDDVHAEKGPERDKGNGAYCVAHIVGQARPNSAAGEKHDNASNQQEE